MYADMAQASSPVFSCAESDHVHWALWGSGDALWDWDLAKGLTYRQGFSKCLRLDTRLINNSDRGLEHLIHPADLVGYCAKTDAYRLGREESFQAEYRLRTKEGSWIWVIDQGKAVARDSQGRVTRAAGTCRNITALKQREERFRLANQVIACMNEAVVITQLDQTVVAVNRAFSRITGFAEEEIVGRNAVLLQSNRHPTHFYDKILERALRVGNWHGEVWQRQKNGCDSLSWLEISLVADQHGQPSHLVGVFSDVTERKQVEEKLWHLANYDMLTGLPGRALFTERLEQAIRRAHRHAFNVALLFIDLDHFKHVNDSMGHHAGDDLLRAVAERLRQSVREEDTVARLGGDEFTIILENIQSKASVAELCKKITDTMNRPFSIQEQDVTISVSIGICFYPHDGTNSSRLIQCADTAMYQAKALGRHNFQFYTDQMNQREMRRLRVATRLRRALPDKELYLVYQPKTNIRGGQVTGFEALLRWRNAELGQVNPVEFIPLAEEMGLIVDIGDWVLEQACAQAVAWQKMGFPPLTVAVNLSAVQFARTSIVDCVKGALQKTGLAPQHLELELTESLIMQDTGQTIELLRELKALGLKVALDDFGTGYSSLSYLTRFPIDTLKIDRTFIANVTSDPSDAAITNAIIAMAHALHLNIIAEGVETPDQRMFLENEGCDELQGYLFSKPLNVNACSRFLRRRQI